MTQDKDWIVDIEIPVTFEDGHTEQVTEITSADHSLTFAYAVDEETARLIAACPDLLAACKELLEIADSDERDFGVGEYDMIMSAAKDRTRTAIAKREKGEWVKLSEESSSRVKVTLINPERSQ